MQKNLHHTVTEVVAFDYTMDCDWLKSYHLLNLQLGINLNKIDQGVVTTSTHSKYLPCLGKSWMEDLSELYGVVFSFVKSHLFVGDSFRCDCRSNSYPVYFFKVVFILSGFTLHKLALL